MDSSTDAAARPTWAMVQACNRVTQVIQATRMMTVEANRRGMLQTVKALRAIEQHADGTRTRLVQEGEGYIDAADALVDTYASRLVRHAAAIGTHYAQVQP